MNNLFFQRAYHIIFIRDSASKKFFGKPFVNERSRKSVVAKRHRTLLGETQFLSRLCPRSSRNKFPFFFPYLHSERKKGGLFYNEIPSLTHFSDSRESRYMQNADCSKRGKKKRRSATVQEKNRDAHDIIYLFLITPDRIYTYIRKLPVCVLLAFILFFPF